MLACVTLLSVVFLLFSYVEANNTLVHTNVGWIQGLPATDGNYDMFLGIPYATVNATNHFGNSIPHPRFDRIFEAHDDSAICPQIDNFVIMGSLDCLHLNIYVPHSASTTNRLPVLVWFHGGGFTTGFGGRFIYGPKYLVRHDVILVTLNYRVGPYGFMCLDIPEVPGNQGLKDQLIALRWIKENIYWFGGDVDKITLFGESAGGRSVDLHLLSSEEKMYRNIMTQSGTTFDSAWLLDSNPAIPQQIAGQLGFETKDVYEALAVLSTIDPTVVIPAAFSDGIQYRPCVEKVFDGIESFLTNYPVNMDVPKANGMPILMGINSQEMLFRFANLRPESFETLDTFSERLRGYFDFEENKLTKLEKFVRQFYIGDEKMSEQVKWDIINFDSDMMYIHPAERSVRKFIDNGAEKVYHYVFAFNGDRNLLKSRLNITVGGASHADELGYLFDISFMTETTSTRDQLVIDRMTTMWTNFAKYSDPTPEITDLLPIKWEPRTRNSTHNYLDIDSSLNLWRRPFHERMVFWDLFFALHGEHQKGYRKDNAQKK